MKRRVLVTFCVGVLMALMASCGQTYSLQSISVTPGAYGATGSAAMNLEGIGSYQTLTVTAQFSNTKTQNVTSSSTFVLGPSADTVRAPLASSM